MYDNHTVYLILDTLYMPAIISYVINMLTIEMPASWGHSLKCKSTQAEKIKYHNTSMTCPSSVHLLIISTQPRAMAHLPAETGVVTMVKRSETVFTNVSIHFNLLLSDCARMNWQHPLWPPLIYLNSHKLEDVAFHKVNTLLPLQFSCDKVYL